MLGNLRPQECVNRFGPRPSKCDIVVLILWSRMGTPLPEDCVKEDGTRYLSGTEWEFEDAINASPAPQLLIYRRTEEPMMKIGDPEAEEKTRQFSLVNQFFTSFKSADGSLRHSFTPYNTVEAFTRRLEEDLEHVLCIYLEHVEARKKGNNEAKLQSFESSSILWWKAALERAASVAAIRRRNGPRIGTGFAVRAGDVGVKPENAVLLLTAFYLVNTESAYRGLTPEQASVSFEGTDTITKTISEISVRKVLSQSPVFDGAGYSLLQLEHVPPEVTPLPLAFGLPPVSDPVSLIGHPAGDGLHIATNTLLIMRGRPAEPS